ARRGRKETELGRRGPVGCSAERVDKGEIPVHPATYGSPPICTKSSLIRGRRDPGRWGLLCSFLPHHHPGCCIPFRPACTPPQQNLQHHTDSRVPVTMTGLATLRRSVGGQRLRPNASAKRR